MEKQQGSRKRSKNCVELKWAEIPNDVLFVIFHKLGVAEVLLSAQAVCRSWRQVALDPASQVWRCIDTRYLRRQQDILLRFPRFHEVKFNQLAIDRSGGNLEKLYLCSGYSGEFLKYITGRTTKLRCLTMISCKPRRKELAYFLARCPLLEELHICTPPSPTEKYKFGCPLLKELHICTPFSPTERYKFEDMQLEGQYGFFVTESYSDFNYSSFVMDNFFDGILTTVPSSKLGYDTVPSSKLGYDTDSESDSENSYCEYRFGRKPYCDKIAVDIATNLPQLRVLQLMRLRISNKGLHAILDKCRKLESLDIRSCFDLKVDDALQAKLAKIKNVKVSHQSLASFDRMVGEVGVLSRVQV